MRLGLSQSKLANEIIILYLLEQVLEPFERRMNIGTDKTFGIIGIRMCFFNHFLNLSLD